MNDQKKQLEHDSNQDDKPEELFQGLAKPRISKGRLPNDFINSKKRIIKNDNEMKKHGNSKPENHEQQKQDQKILKKGIGPSSDYAVNNNHPQKQKANKNPLLPIKNSIKIFEQFQEDLNSANQLLFKFQKYRLGPSTKALQLKLDQCMTLTFVKKLKNNGCLKKILHAPTFKIHYLQQQPINLKDDKTIIQQWLQSWQKCASNEYQLKTHGFFWNTPSGFLSLVYQYPQYKSLKQVLEIAGSIPQNIIKKISKQLIDGLGFLQKNGIIYQNIEAQQFFFDEGTRLKFYPKLELDYKNNESKFGISIVNQFLNIPINQKQSETDKLVFKLGFLIFTLSFGTFLIEQQIIQILMNITKAIKKQYCCVIHAIQKQQNNLPLYQLFKSKLSKQFLDFLCNCLRFDYKQRISLQSLKSHKFLIEIDPINKIQLMDLIKLTKQQPYVFKDIVKKGGEARLKNVLEALQLILTTSEQISNMNIKKDNGTIICLSQETGLDVDYIHNRVINLYNEFNK